MRMFHVESTKDTQPKKIKTRKKMVVEDDFDNTSQHLPGHRITKTTETPGPKRPKLFSVRNHRITEITSL
jgi:hypothetical protein